MLNIVIISCDEICSINCLLSHYYGIPKCFQCRKPIGVIF